MPALPISHNVKNPNSQRSIPRLNGAGRFPTAVGTDGSPFLMRTEYPGLDEVLQQMKKLVRDYKGNPKVRDWAVNITSGIPNDSRTGLPDRRNYQQIAQAVYQWMKKNVAYVRDPDEVEWLQSPVKTLEKREGLNYGYGDCDDQAVAAAALLSSVGVPTRFKVVKNDPASPDAYSHVFLEYKANGHWKPFDPTLHTKAGDGLSESQVFGSKTVALSDGLSGCNCGQGLSDSAFSKNWKILGVVLLAGAFAFSYSEKFST